MSLPNRRLTPASEALLGLCWNYLIAHEQALHDRTLNAAAAATASSLRAHWPTGQPAPTGRGTSTTERDALNWQTGDDEGPDDRTETDRGYAADLAQIRDDFATYSIMFHTSLNMLNRINTTPHDLRELPRCGVPWPDPISGETIPCPKIADDHRYAKLDPDTGTTTDVTVSGYCDDHWNALCATCHARPAEQYRTMCSTCRKAAQRRGDTAA